MLLQSLTELDFDLNIVDTVSDYLRERMQVTVINGMQSTLISVTSGVLQGTILEPLLFICLTNDLPTVVYQETGMQLFVDDSCVDRVTAGLHLLKQPFKQTLMQTSMQ